MVKISRDKQELGSMDFLYFSVHKLRDDTSLCHVKNFETKLTRPNKLFA